MYAIRSYYVDADALLAEVHGEVAHRGFQRGLGHAHDVVVGDDLLRTVVGHGDDLAVLGEHGLEGLV